MGTEVYKGEIGGAPMANQPIRSQVPTTMIMTGWLLNGKGELTPTIPSANWQQGHKFVSDSPTLVTGRRS